MRNFKSFIALIAICAFFVSCEKNDTLNDNGLTSNEEFELNNAVFDLMLKASTEPEIVESMNGEAFASYQAGLDESIYLGEIMSYEGTTVKSSANSNILKAFFINNMQVTKSGEIQQ